MKRARAAGVAAVLTWAMAALPAHADLAGARTKYRHGDYKGARAELERVSGAGADAAHLELARVELRTGHYAEAEKRARAAANSRDLQVAADATVLLAEILRTTGRWPEAEKLIEPLASRRPDLLRARYVLGRIYRDVGDPRGDALWKALATELAPDKIDFDKATPEMLFYAAEAARYTDNFQLANDLYREVIDRDPSLHEANIEWGYLFLEKYAPADAEQSFDEVLKIDPHHPDAHAGEAAVKLESTYDLAAATRHLDDALAVNPRHVPSLLLEAGIEIDQNQWDKAEATLDQVFAVNPHDLEGHSLLATIHWLRDDTAGYQAEKKIVFGVNPHFARFFHIVARSAEREHRYTQAIDLEKQAVGVDPAYYEAMESIGAGYLRLGMEKEGLSWLRKSWAGDQYNMRTKNTLDLFEDYIPKEYSFAISKDKNFKIRYPNDEEPVLRRYVEPLLERAFADMVKRYGFTPKTPVVVELYKNPDHYSVRTVGLPNLGALGICFGQVITAMSPTVGDINWGMVLWHELSHVFAIQLSNSRVPRWFTEGLSEYETVLARPEWRRENDIDVWGAIQDGVLPSIAELNYGFMKPDMQEVVVAYHLASLCIEFLAQTYGFPKIVEALKLYGQGLETPAVLAKITGKTIPELDAQFRGYLDVRLAPYKGTFHIPTAGMSDIKALKKAAAAAPRSAEAHARLALGHYQEGDARAARAAADKALSLDRHNPLGLYVEAELDMREGKRSKAKTLYEDMIRAGADSFDVRARLGQIDAATGNIDEAEKHFCTAKKLDPESSYPYEALAQLYAKQGKKRAALGELETYAMLEQMQLSPVKKLVDDYSAMKRWNKVRVYGEMALEINPEQAGVLLELGRAYLETGSPDKALYSYDSALVVRPQMRRPALAEVGRAQALLALGKRRAARAAVTRALKIEPDNADALALVKQTRAGH